MALLAVWLIDLPIPDRLTTATITSLNKMLRMQSPSNELHTGLCHRCSPVTCSAHIYHRPTSAMGMRSKFAARCSASGATTSGGSSCRAQNSCAAACAPSKRTLAPLEVRKV